MQDKTSKNESQQTVEEQTKPADQEKVPVKSMAERRADIIIAGLENAKANGGEFLNTEMKLAPRFYPKGLTMSPFNQVIMALHSDQNGFKTNDYTLFSEAKSRGEAVRGGQKGVPFSWITWNEYQKINDPESSISRSEYKALSPEEQQQYKGIRHQENRIVFNVDQTNMSHVNKEAYERLLHERGTSDVRDIDANYDKNLRVEVNQFILGIRDNLVSIKKNANGIASYDREKDVVNIPAQNAYNSYPEYVQDVSRHIITATAHPQRLARHSSKNYETLLTELASAARQMQFGLPAKLSPKALEQVGNMIDFLKKNPKQVEYLEKDINASISMMKKAENGEKVELRPTAQEMDRWHANLPKEGTVPDKFESVLMMKDLENKWTLFVKPENENVFAVHPTPADTSLFFNYMKGSTMENTENFRMEMGQKYYAEVAQHPEKAVDAFGQNIDSKEKEALEKVLVFKTKDEVPKLMIYPTLTTGEKLKPRELTQDQWQMIWLAPDQKDFKKTLAANIFKDEIAEKLQDSQKQSQQSEQHTEQKEPVTLDVPKWALNYIVNGDAEGLSDEEKEIVDKFLDENFADGFVPEIVEGKDKDFNVSPAFGTRNPNALPDKGESPYLAVETSEVKFYPGGYFERRDEEQKQKNKEEKIKSSPEQKEKEKQEEKAKEAKTKAETKAVAKVALSPMLKQFYDLKKKHPDALLLFRCGDFYETYQKDAEKAAKVLGITLTRSTNTKDKDGKPLAMAGFPYHALDTYLPKLIRAGERVAICDQIEAPKQTTKRGITEVIAPAEKQKEKQQEQKEENLSHGFHR